MMRILFFSFSLLFISCAHRIGESTFSSRSIATRDQDLSIFWELSARHILDYRPLEYGDLDQILLDKENLYSLLGEIDQGLVEGIPSRIEGRQKEFKTIFLLEDAEQISFEEWKLMRNEVLKAFESGHHVFEFEESFYSIWGLKLSKENISPAIIRSVEYKIPDYPMNKFLLEIFNRYKVIQAKGNRFYKMPHLVRVPKRYISLLNKDFLSQIKTSGISDIYNLLRSDQERLAYKIDDYENYYAQKFKHHKKGIEYLDYETACETQFYLKSAGFKPTPRLFIQTLISHKSKLMRELSLSNNEYDELMTLAVGILAVESKMGTSFKYKLKEDVRIGNINFGQLAIRYAKWLRGRSDTNSRGLTQIKNIGPFINDTSYSYLEDADLNDPLHAALATMFVLKEKHGFLEHFKERHSNISDYNWADYLYYFYQGSSREITRGTATPKLNLRIQKILRLKKDMILFRKCE